MIHSLALLFKSKLAVAVLGTVLIVGAGTSAALAANGAQMPFVSNGHLSSAASSGNGSSDNTSHHDGQQAEGAISSVDSGHSSFVLTPEQGSAVTVVVNAQTEFEGGLHSFADLKVGLHAEAKGSFQSDGSLLATKVEGQNDGNDNGDQNANENELTGTIGSINTANSTFVLQVSGGTTKTVQVSKSTEFDGGVNSFSDLKTGMTVEVKGNLQSDGTLAATRVHREDDGSGGSGSSGSGSSGSGSGGHGDGDG
ncbi:MAG TPA: DUF5666 domain-containing protein [Ktedonobacterales bacterium]|nr:DUF5666 domain-containing protein [Ktedonobacterales bacterium]